MQRHKTSIILRTWTVNCENDHLFKARSVGGIFSTFFFAYYCSLALFLPLQWLGGRLAPLLYLFVNMNPQGQTIARFYQKVQQSHYKLLYKVNAETPPATWELVWQSELTSFVQTKQTRYSVTYSSVGFTGAGRLNLLFLARAILASSLKLNICWLSPYMHRNENGFNFLVLPLPKKRLTISPEISSSSFETLPHTGAYCL